MNAEKDIITVRRTTMQVQNPDYKYLVKLAGTWKNAEGTCIVTLTKNVGITVAFNDTVLNGTYGVFPVDPSYWPGLQKPEMLMMGAMGMMGQNATFHSGEDIKLKLGNRALKNGDQALFFIDDIWHDLDDSLHIDIKDLYTGAMTALTLLRETSDTAPVLKEGEVLCQCGQVFSSRFCPNCGQPRNA